MADVDPPRFGKTCPQNIQVFANRGKKWALVMWPTVAAIDNSGEKPKLDEIAVRREYVEGKHDVAYVATDAAGNKGYCNFTITVKGNLCSLLRLITMYYVLST